MFRRFGQEHCRVLLHLEAEITRIKQDLDALDTADSQSEKLKYRLKRNEWCEGWDRAQKDLLENLRVKLVQYGMWQRNDSRRDSHGGWKLDSD
jgi:hypothetical protein